MTSLVPIPVPGTDRQVMAMLVAGTPMVSLRHACDAIGIESQRRKLAAKSWATAVITTAVAADGGTVRQVYAYTESDRPLFDSVWAKHYAGVVAEAALTGVSDGS